MAVSNSSVRKFRVAGAAVLAAGALGAATLTAAPAQAAPIAVQQIPANGVLSMGLGAWSGYAAAIRVRTANVVGQAYLSAPGGDACNRGAAGKYVRYDYTNVSSGRGGSVTVRPCPGPFSGPLEVKISPGPGQIVGTITIVSPGVWAIPGGATFAL
ncbi:MAG: hypothetical protein WAW85_08430 [Gordonia sp. (in: high G+C Gram-positive bacteria)]|uniref:hypothetical protein n=1 Tax=Gordonia sp. (in: high G+C Gram-positive bacteria) TaxID=84139 RepID=UPI003BB7CA01